MSEQKKLHAKLIPQQVKKLRETVVETGKLMNVQEFECLRSIKHHGISRIFDILKNLRKAANISIEYECGEYETLEVIVKKEDN